MRNCWLSPEGEVIFCDNHDMKAWDLIEERYGVHRSEVKDPSIFLGEKRWMAYHNRPWQVEWWSYYYSKGPTQAQVDRIYELTGDVVELGKEGGLYCSFFSLFLLQNYKFMVL